MSARRLVLASQSPRRLSILVAAGFEFDILPSQISEIPNQNLNLTSQIRQLARDKAEACLKMRTDLKSQGILLLAADTVVVLAGQILGKPKDEEEARTFLRRLSGQTHQVITAVCLADIDTDRWWSDHATTDVKFRDLTDQEIDSYVRSGDPMDKAGGYGIQGEAARFVASISGPFDNVVGLPMQRVQEGLQTLAVTLPNSRSGRRETIAAALQDIRGRLIQACHRAGRPNDAVRLIAVSKTKPALDVVDAVFSRQLEFGENYAQEAIAKRQAVDELVAASLREPPSVKWHFIGSLQSKKVKSVVGEFSLIHSVDRLSLLEEINSRAREKQLVQDVLLQINIAGETTKSGVGRDEFLDFFTKVRSFLGAEARSVRLRGLMAMPPITDDETQARGHFAAIYQLFKTAKESLPAPLQASFNELSMGTTHDFEWAVLEGATIVRVGTAIFGERSAE